MFTKMSKENFRYGGVEDLRIPRPIKEDKTKFASGDTTFQASLDAQRADEAAGVDRVYVKFVDAQDALKALAGRSFAGRSIIATVLNEDSQTTLESPQFDLRPQPDAPPPLPCS